MKKRLSTLLVFILCIAFAMPVWGAVSTKATAISKTSLKMPTGTSQVLSIKNPTGKVTWKTKTNKYITVLDKSSNSVELIAKKPGNTVVKAQVGNRTYSCNVRIYTPAFCKSAPQVSYQDKSGKKPVLSWSKVKDADGYLLRVDWYPTNNSADTATGEASVALCRTKEYKLGKNRISYSGDAVKPSGNEHRSFTLTAYKDTAQGRIYSKSVTVSAPFYE